MNTAEAIRAIEVELLIRLNLINQTATDSQRRTVRDLALDIYQAIETADDNDIDHAVAFFTHKEVSDNDTSHPHSRG